MLKQILKRILQAIPTLFVVVTVTFILTRMIPGDPITAMVGDQMDTVTMDRLRMEMGLDKSIPEQYIRYLGDVIRGNFGNSVFYLKPATTMILERLPNTLMLSLTSLVLAILIGVSLGVLTGIKQYSAWDYIFTVLALIGVSIPVFWLGLMLVLVFSVNLGWLPTLGMGSMAKGAWDVISHMILPCVCIAVIPTATFTRITRSSMIEAMNNDSIRCLRARGLREKLIIWRHALKNALPSILTVVGIQLAGTFSGSVITESIFSWPGMGTMISNAIDNRDYALIQGTVLAVAIAFVVVNLIVDIFYMVINPKVAADNRKGAS